jgi:predicted protein tyrosine phosphatase
MTTVPELPNVQILSRDLMKGVLRSAIPSRVHHVVSISDPADGPPEEVRDHPGRALVLLFHDIPEPDEDLTVPTRKDVKAIVKFAEAIGPGENVLCHCNAGISRSSAAALTILASKLGNSRQAAMDAVQHLLAIKTIIHPNRLMVQYADEILGFDGALVEAHASTFLSGGLFLP